MINTKAFLLKVSSRLYVQTNSKNETIIEIMKTTIGMFKAIIFFLLISFPPISGQQIEMDLPEFNRIVLSPYIELKLIEGDEEYIRIEAENIDPGKINIIVNHRKLRIYLDDAKYLPKNETSRKGKEKYIREMYRDAQIYATVTYKEIKSLAVMGEEQVSCKGSIKNNSFKLRTIGETNVLIEDIEVETLKIKSIGENEINIAAGEVIVCITKLIGENKVSIVQMKAKTARFSSIGENEMNCNAEEKLRIRTIGESELVQYGKAKIRKGFRIGENEFTYASQY